MDGQQPSEGSEAIAPEAIDVYLKGLSREGLHHSGGQFTLTREKALAKLGAFQLPFSGAWCVKLVQAIVASSSKHEISIKQTREETVIHFIPGQAWTVAEVEGRYYTPASGPRADLSHFVSALWALTLKDNRGLHLTLPGQREALSWTREGLVREGLEVAPTRGRLAVSHFSVAETTGASAPTAGWRFFTNRSRARARNAEVAKAVADHCYTCPIPLLLDSRRIDALQDCPQHGLSQRAAPLALGFRRGDLPILPIPQGTFEWKMSDRADKSTRTSRLGEWVERCLEPGEDVSLAFIVAIHLKRRTPGGPYVPAKASSTLHWVLDGAVIGIEELPVIAATCAVGVFVSAAGLATDLSTFNLIDHPMVSERRMTAGRLIEAALNQVSVSGDGHDRPKRGLDKEILRKMGPGVVFALVGSTLAAPASVFVSVMMFALGSFWCASSIGPTAVSERDLEKGMVGLRRNFAEVYA